MRYDRYSWEIIIQNLNKKYRKDRTMSSKCSSCSQLSQNYEILSCGHTLCN